MNQIISLNPLFLREASKWRLAGHQKFIASWTRPRHPMSKKPAYSLRNRSQMGHSYPSIHRQQTLCKKSWCPASSRATCSRLTSLVKEWQESFRIICYYLLLRESGKNHNIPLQINSRHAWVNSARSITAIYNLHSTSDQLSYFWSEKLYPGRQEYIYTSGFSSSS